MKEISSLNTVEVTTQIQKRLIQLLENDFFSETNKLPREDELAKSLGVSRASLREVLTNLEQEGYIIRRKRHGTFVNKRVINLKTRIDIELEFSELIERAGYKKASIQFIMATIVEGDDILLEKLGGSKGEKLYKVERLMLADEFPVIYCEDYFLTSQIKSEDYLEGLEKTSLFDFFKEYCQKEIYFNVSKVKAKIPIEKVKKRLELEDEDAVLTIEEIGYDIDQNPLFVGYEYYNQNHLDFYLFKKKY